MTLSAARGPLSTNPAGRFAPDVPRAPVYVEPHPRRIIAILDGRTVIDSESALLVHRAGQPLAFVFPAAEVAGLPSEAEPAAPGYVHVPWDAIDEWYEEGRLLVHYPPNPYHRVDCRPTHRRLRVEVAGTILVDTTETIILFETALEPKLYVPKAAVRMDLLRVSDTTTYCNYKGHCTWWSAVIDGAPLADVAWSYEDALPESQLIEGWLSFEPANATVDAELPGRSG